MSTQAKFDISVAVLGTGYMGKQYINVFRETVRDVIVCGADEKGKELAQTYGLKYYTDYETMFAVERPLIAAICLPTPLHYAAAMCAFKYGSHVMCEKPFAANSAQAREMIDTANAAGLTLMVGHIVRFSGYYEYLKQCIDDGRFGKLLHLELFRHHAMPTWSVGGWLADAKQSGGIIKDLHIHDTDMINWLLGMPESVYSTGDNIHSCYTIYRYPGDLTVTATGTWRVTSFAPSHGYDAVFEKASLKFDFDRLIYSGIPAKMEITTENLLQKELMYFCSCVLNGEKPLKCMPEDSLKSLIINEAETASLMQRAPVSLR